MLLESKELACSMMTRSPLTLARLTQHSTADDSSYFSLFSMRKHIRRLKLEADDDVDNK
jgi:hypothetical protein